MASFLSHAPSRTAVVTDGKYTVSHADLFDYFGSLDRDLHARNIGPSVGIGLFCDQSVASAIALLGLLARHQCMLLLPANADGATVPTLFRYLVRSEASGPFPSIERLNLQITENPQWAGSGSGHEKQQIFLRTSGSTGGAKLVAHSHERLYENALNVGRRLRIAASDRIALPVPIHHMYGLGAGLLPSILASASVNLQAGANLIRYLDHERTFNPDVAFLTPVFALMLAKGRPQQRPYRLTVIAGDRLPRETFDRYSQQSGLIVQVYGSTEMGAIAATSPDDPPAARAETAGTALPGVELRIEESTGQLLCRHEYGFEAYVDDEGLCVPAPVYFETGDFAQFDASGRIRISGRSDSRCKRDGLWVSITDVEAALTSIPDIVSSVVVPAGESGRGIGLVAFCVLRDSIKTTGEQLRQACFELLPRRAVPDIVETVSNLPVLESGKFDRQRLRELALALIGSESFTGSRVRSRHG